MFDLQSEQAGPFEVLRDLLNEKNIPQKSQLNMKQIKAHIRAKYLLERLNPNNKTPIEAINKTLDYHLSLMCSYKRESRKEIVKSISEMSEKFFQENIMSPDKKT